jgi:hypothetical protein
MSRPKPGDEVTYTTGHRADKTRRTGILLDRAPETGYWWVHREDGTFDLVRIYVNKDHTYWYGRYTASGRPIPEDEQVA